MRLILLPGMDGTGDLFAALVAALPPTITPQLISYPCDRDLTYPELVELVLLQLPAGEPFVVLGESFSGPVAIGVAARRPAQLAGVVLCVTFARSTRPKMPRLPLPKLGFSFTEWSLKMSRAPWVWRLLLGQDFTPDLYRQLLAAVDRNLPSVLAGRIREMAKVDVVSAVASLNVPVLYLRALQDRIVPRKAGDLIRAANPAIQMVELPGSHFLLQAHARVAAGPILAFCRNLNPETPS